MLTLAHRRELGTIEHREGIAATDLDVIMPSPIWRTRGADQPHTQYTAVKLQRGFHIIRVDADVIDIHGCFSFAGLVYVKAVEVGNGSEVQDRPPPSGGGPALRKWLRNEANVATR